MGRVFRSRVGLVGGVAQLGEGGDRELASFQLVIVSIMPYVSWEWIGLLPCRWIGGFIQHPNHLPVTTPNLILTRHRSRGSLIITEPDRLEERPRMQFIKPRQKVGAPTLSILDYPTPGSVPTAASLNVVSICERGKQI